jgi:hypothetical protein
MSTEDKARDALARVLFEADVQSSDQEVTDRLWRNITGRTPETEWHRGADAVLAWHRTELEAVMLRHRHADDCAAWGRPPRPLTAACTCWKADLRAALGAARDPQPWEHDGHNPRQHRDGKPPWCNECGWTSPVPAIPAVQIKEVDRG